MAPHFPRPPSSHAMPSFALLCVLVLLKPVAAAAANFTFPRYSYRDHPLHTHPDPNLPPPKPVVMRSYIMRDFIALQTTDGLLFSPRAAVYASFPDPLDVLFVPPISINHPNLPDFLHVELNHPARVMLLLVTRSMHTPSEPTFAKTATNATVPRVSGLSTKWRPARYIATASGRAQRLAHPTSPLTYYLPPRAAVVEATFQPSQHIVLPSPIRVYVDGNPVHQIVLLFAQPSGGNINLPPVPFPYPSSPTSLARHVPGRSLHGDLSPLSPAVPNQRCPFWLHKLYITAGPDAVTATKMREPQNWETWHPIVDPVYWCYFDHEHGSYPGKYRPRFGYTAWKTMDLTTTHKRQEESHPGFKVFAVPLPSERLFMIITAHMHCASPRRFYTRHHTVIFALFDHDWKLRMELHMKMDFGFAAFSTPSFHTIPMNPENNRLRKELGFPVNRFRRFNVIDLRNYPRRMDPAYRTRTGAKPTMANKDIISLGVYERWNAPLNTCSAPKRRNLDAFVFDFRDAASGKRHKEDSNSAPMSHLAGFSVNRILRVSYFDNISISPEYCRFDNSATEDIPAGVFYTDPYFSHILESAGAQSVRQYIAPNFQKVSISGGEYSAVDPWAGHYESSSSMHVNRRCHTNIEFAIDAEMN